MYHTAISFAKWMIERFRPWKVKGEQDNETGLNSLLVRFLAICWMKDNFKEEISMNLGYILIAKI